MMSWLLENPARFLHEQKELKRLESEHEWLNMALRFQSDGKLSVEINMTIHGRIYEGKMTYPDSFPDSPPYIRPRDRSERWSNHQYGEGGSLCLQWRADNWQPDITGADMVLSAFELLNTEQHPELPNSVPSAHRLTEGQILRGSTRRLILTTDIMEAWNNLPPLSSASLKTATLFSSDKAVTFITQISDVDNNLKNVEDVPQSLGSLTYLLSLSGEGWVFKSEGFDLKLKIKSAEDLIQAITNEGFDTVDILVQEDNKYKARTIVLLGRDGLSLRTFYLNPGDEPTIHEFSIIWPSSTELRLSKESQRLTKIRIGIIGLGSMGSKIATSLARSGIKRFLLVDDDYLATSNIVRHELYWNHVGKHKVEGVKSALSLISAGIEVDESIIRLAGQESSVFMASILNDLSKCDLLIDATANPEVFLQLSALAKRYKIPLCWGEIFAGGYGGMIARSRPGYDPNPLAVRDAFYSHLSTLPKAPFDSAQNYDGSEEQPLTAYDSDVGFIATALTRLAIDTALSRDPSVFPYSLYLLGMRCEWIFEQPFDTHPVHVSGAGWDTDDTSVSEEDRLAALQAILQIYEGEERAEPDTSG